MKALVYDRYGGPEVLRVADLPDPRPGPAECLVRVRAASVNPADWKLMQGQWRFATGRRLPRPIGIDFSGTVERVGGAVRGFAPGDRVMGMVNPLVRGSMAELVAVPARSLSRAPRNLALEEAAGLPVACATAYLALHHRRRRLDGRRVLLTGAGGGVGHFALQLAAQAGAQVTAVCSERQGHAVPRAGRLPRARLPPGQPGGFRWALRPGPGLRLQHRLQEGASSAGAASGNTCSWTPPAGSFPSSAPLVTQLSAGRKMWTFLVTPSGRRGERLAELFERVGLRVVIGGVYPLSEAAEAFRESLRGHALGKIVVTPG